LILRLFMSLAVRLFRESVLIVVGLGKTTEPKVPYH
jgi:hypothetical protein